MSRFVIELEAFNATRLEPSATDSKQLLQVLSFRFLDPLELATCPRCHVAAELADYATHLLRSK